MGIYILKNIGKKIGIDRSIAYSSGARIVQAFTGVGSIFFISRFLTGVEQGFYYTFGSIVAIQVFFELGLTGIIVQYVAHEASHLKIVGENIEGEEKYKSRLSSLLHFCVKWYSVISILLFITLLIAGFVFFNSYGGDHKNVEWRLPWILICIGTIIKLFQSPLNSYIEGLGYVKEMCKVSFWQQIILPLSAWIGLAFDFKLYVVGISSILSALTWNVYVRHTFLWSLLKYIWNTKISERMNYMEEIFPYQWRIALSWISGYFIFQLFNPVLFATEGPKVAGQMGMTLNVLNAIQAFSISWISTKIPSFSKLIALKNYSALDKDFVKSTIQMVCVCLFLLLIMLLGLYVIRVNGLAINGELLANRFLGYFPILLMMVALVVNILVFALATYLRCHKKEPFLYESIVMGILSMFNTLIFGKMYGLYGICIGYCLLTLLFSLPWSFYLYVHYKHKWHE